MNYVPRERNTRADALSNEAIDSPLQGLDVGGLACFQLEPKVVEEVKALVDDANRA